VYSNKLSEAYPANNMIPTQSHFSVFVLQNVKSIMPNGMWKHTLLMLHKTINAANIGVHGNLECSFNHSSFTDYRDV